VTARPPDRAIPCRSLDGRVRLFPAAAIRFRPAAYGIAVRDGRVLLGRSAFTGRWDIPGGAVEPSETLEEGLCREFREETGVTPEPVRLLHVDESFVYFFRHAFHSLRFYYLVRVPEGATLVPDPREIHSLAWVDVEAVPEEEFAPGDRAVLRLALAADG
jgi:8-oxo-dGTP pyrophosphatase MutT (NUDIX family)